MFYPHTIKGKPFPRLDLIANLPITPTLAVSTALLNGTTQYFDAGNDNAFQTTNLSGVVRFRLDSLGSFQTIISKEDRNANITQSWDLRVTPTNFLELVIRQNVVNNVILTSSTTLTTGVWYFAAFTLDGSNIRLYLNAVLAAGPSAFSTVHQTTATLSLGSTILSGSQTRLLDGSIGFVGMFSTGITSGQVTSLYNLGNAICYDELENLIPGITSNMVSYWHLANWSGSSGTEIEDRHGSFDLTNFSSTPFTGTGLDIEC